MKKIIFAIAMLSTPAHAFDRWEGNRAFERQSYENERALRDSQYQMDRNEEIGRHMMEDSHRRFDRFMND